MPLDHPISRRSPTSGDIAATTGPASSASAFLSSLTQPLESADALRGALIALLRESFGDLPLPGRGRTLDRWRSLSAVAAHDLSLAKLFEGHTDAVAIIADLGAPALPLDATWAVWAAESKQARLDVRRGTGTSLLLRGRKSWCSGAKVVSHAIVTAWDGSERQRLVAVPLHQPGVRITGEGWSAVGMAASGSVDVLFENAEGIAIGDPGAYTSRPGFWHGGAGIAACWYGGAARLGETLRNHVAVRPEPHASAHLGAVSVALTSTLALLHATAARIDAKPDSPQIARVLSVRAAAEQTSRHVIDHAGRALGAFPFCRDAVFARMVADLPVFIRQTHAERDLETIGNMIAEEGPAPWML